MAERLDMDAINRQYFEKRGFTKSSKNQAADYFVQLGTALHFSLDLLKEDWNHNKRYSFAPEDVELIHDMLDRLKSREGKRLRCRDYQGAGGVCILKFIEDILHLLRSNGVSENIVWEQEIRMHILTEYVARITQAVEQKPELGQYVGICIFQGSAVGEMDGFSEMDQYVYWTCLVEHPEITVDEALGIYWCWWSYRFQNLYDESYYRHKRIKHMSESERDYYLMLSDKIDCFTALTEGDAELQDALSEWRRITYGGGKLQDNQRLAGLIRQIAEHFERHVDAVFELQESDGTPAEAEPPYPYSELYGESMKLLLAALDNFRDRVEGYRMNDPIWGSSPSTMEIAYQRRFHRPLVPVEEKKTDSV